MNNNNDKCKKCRWLYPNFEYGDLTSENHLLLGTCSNPFVEHVEITPSDETIKYSNCTDYVPLPEFQDEELEKSLNDNVSEVMDFD